MGYLSWIEVLCSTTLRFHQELCLVETYRFQRFMSWDKAIKCQQHKNLRTWQRQYLFSECADLRKSLFFLQKSFSLIFYLAYIYVIQRLVCPNFQSEVLCKSVAECSCRLLLVLDVKINTSIKHSKSIWRVACLLNEESSELLIKSNGSLLPWIFPKRGNSCIIIGS